MKKEQIEKIMAEMPTGTSLNYAATRDDDKRVVVFSFSEKGLGFGEITFVETSDGHRFIDTERMKLETVKRMLNRWVDSAIPDWDTDPERHKLYNERMGSSCGEGCKVCYPQ